MSTRPQWSNINEVPKGMGSRVLVALSMLHLFMAPAVIVAFIVSVSHLPLPWRLASATVCMAALLAAPVWMLTRQREASGWAFLVWWAVSVVGGLGAAAVCAQGAMANAPTPKEGTSAIVVAALMFGLFGFHMPMSAGIVIDSLRHRMAASYAADTEARVAKIVTDAETARAKARRGGEERLRKHEAALTAIGDDHAAQMLRIRQTAEAEHDRRLRTIEEEYQQRLNVELAHASACKECARRDRFWSSRSTDAAFVYVILHEEFAAVKVGISTRSARSGRLRAHTDQRWKVVGIVERLTHHQAKRVEDAAKAWMRTLAGPALTAEQMPQGGYTETAGADLVPPDKLWAQVKELAVPHGGLPLRLDT
ncbi:hypothetical protein [Streptomyces nigrescens]|uniref:hypothetical protein n=1 Tax=Streptomyces nigrescens TaxID=1920 RepID=UPI00224DEC02|nr:hypothetical protein [Streptomyces libani]MCX5450275.1 hypothetical protein [Streptomyces libani]